ncbi:MAG: SDR family NAD(P)-dependent oxidoreductase [Anaerolineae bacterium]|nr:SDR family NAD(P)-dependent oxidoreductase [Anaerolineae bacterium]
MSERRTKHILITGATGFLGGALARHLVESGAPVVALARSAAKAGDAEAQGLRVVRGDLTNRESLRRAVEDCDVVVHCAASFGHPDEQRDVNVNGTRTLAEECAFGGVRLLIYVSSIVVYGFGRRGVITEDMPAMPGVYAYAKTKYGGELAIKEVALHTGLSTVIVRPGMIYGPGSVNWTDALFRYARRKPVVFPGDGSGSTHPIYIDDVVEMLVRIVSGENLNGEIFNCSPDPAPTWREWLLGYARLAGHQSWLSLPPFLAKTAAGMIMGFAPPASLLRDLPELLDQYLEKSVFSTARARERLGWSAQVGLTEGIERCAPYLREKGLL